METLARKYSVFLSPAGKDFQFCDSLVREFCRRFDIPPFEPHVTVYSGMFPDPEKLKEAVSAAVRGIGPLELKVRGAGCSEEFFKTLFIDFHEHELLQVIRRRIGESLPVDSGYQLKPHLSLLYREMPLADKRALAQGLHIDRETISFDRIAVSTPGNSAEGWRDTGSWRTVCRIPLEEER